MSTQFAIVAKAGGSGEASENTCEAISAALRLAVPASLRLVVEIDLRSSADAGLVALHDATLERTTNGRGLVRRSNVAELCSLQAGPRGERVPLLDEVIDVAGLHELVLELHDTDLVVADVLGAALARRTAAERESVLVASEHSAVVRAFRARCPRIRTAATAQEAWRKLLFGRMRLDGLVPRGHPWIVPTRHRGIQVVTRRFAESAAAAGDDVWIYGEERLVEIEHFRRLGVSGAFTSRPAALIADLARHACAPNTSLDA